MNNKQTTYKKMFYIFNSSHFIPLDKIHILFLKIFRSKRKFPLINDDDIEKIRIIKSKLQPEPFRNFWDLENEESFVGSALCMDIIQVYKIVTDTYYILIGSHYNCYHIAVFNSIDRCIDIFQVFDFILSNFKYKPFICDCRDETTYPILMLLEKHGRIRIINDYTRERDGEIRHHIKFKTIYQKRKKYNSGENKNA